MGQTELRSIVGITNIYVSRKWLLEQYKDLYGLSEGSFNRTLAKMINNREIQKIKPINKAIHYYKKVK